MAKQNPDQFLIKVGDGADPVAYSTLCGLATRSMTIGGEAIDVTTAPCDGSTTNAWRETLHGLRQVEVSGSGFFDNKAQVTSFITKKFTGDGIDDFQVIVPGLGTFEGKFLIGEIGLGGEVNGGGVTQEFSLSSAGVITFTAEA